ncbi:uncharacterized protein LOC143025482 [Oratosquilla oratoria]|uniref:uncharacterized protein LOC143025482 n=1 Tax=Oratosquilla oratoria TaxID=337810 RepID=UPI003F75E0F3
MLDTGTEVSLVQEVAVAPAKLSHYGEGGVVLRTVNGSQLRHAESVLLILTFPSIKIKHDFLVVNETKLPVDLILGMDFALKDQVRLRITPLEIYIRDERVPAELISCSQGHDKDLEKEKRVSINWCENSYMNTSHEGGNKTLLQREEKPRADTSSNPNPYETSTKGRVEPHIGTLLVRFIDTKSLDGFSCGTVGLVVTNKRIGMMPQKVSAEFVPWERAEGGEILTSGIVELQQNAQGYFWFKAPYVHFQPREIELMPDFPVGDVNLLGEVQIDQAREEKCEQDLGKQVRRLNSKEQVVGFISRDSLIRKFIGVVNSKFTKQNSRENKVLRALVTKCEQVFSLKDQPLTVTLYFFHEIRCTGPPIFKRPYLIPMNHQEEVKAQMKDMCRKGIIQPSKSPYNSPLVPVVKKDGFLRLCLDFRGLNKVIENDRFPLPNLLLRSLGKSTIFSCIDLRQGYHQIPLAPNSREKTAFITPDGHYEYCTLPFGLKDVPSCFQRVMNMTLTGLIGRTAFVYMDDVVIFGSSWEEHLQNLEDVLARTESVNLSLKLEKCDFFKN